MPKDTVNFADTLAVVGRSIVHTPAAAALFGPRCRICGQTLRDGDGDNWDDNCPGCADLVSDFMDEHDVGEDEAEEAIDAMTEEEREAARKS